MSDDHVLANRRSWDADADEWVERGRRDWAREDIGWGVWHVSESELHLLPELDGLDVVELGCGTGYVSAWLARGGLGRWAWTTPGDSSQRRKPSNTNSTCGSR